MTCTHKKATVFLLLLALLTGLFAMPGHAQDMNAYQVSVQWMDDWGETQTAYATPIPYQGYEMGYWLQLPYGVQPWRAALYIQDMTGIHTSFSLPNGTLLENVPEAGDNLSSAQPIEITGFTQDGNPGIVLRLYVSTMAPLPQDPSTPVIMPANVKVHYVDAATYAPIASDTEKTIYQSGEVVTPEAWDLQPNYELTGEASYTITLDYNGASPAEVTFYYNKQAPQPANVKVHYVDATTYEAVASDTEKTIYQSGEVVTPEAWDLQPNYELTGEASYTITLDYNGASPAEVTFYYNNQAPQPANVKVHYVDAATNSPIASDTEKTIYQSGE
ncbi:MAG: hypothetical protein IKJ51_11455, partial [Clostridia bacterium]|nr:hypothetical protein [Clostridia bacterium]